MKKLLETLAADFDDAEGWIRIVDADWYPDDLRLSLSVKLYDDSEPELWEIECENVIEENLTSEGTELLNLIADSPLLKPYNEQEVDLMFSKNSLAPEFLFGVVCSCCVEIMGKPSYIQRFMNLQPTVTGIASSEYGLLGRFPDSIAKRIVGALKGHPISINALPGSEPKRWTGSEFVSYPTLMVLEIGESYVIAERFSASRA